MATQDLEPVQSGELITADFMNSVISDINDLDGRVAALEGAPTAPPATTVGGGSVSIIDVTTTPVNIQPGQKARFQFQVTSNMLEPVTYRFVPSCTTWPPPNVSQWATLATPGGAQIPPQGSVSVLVDVLVPASQGALSDIPAVILTLNAASQDGAIAGSSDVTRLGAAARDQHLQLVLSPNQPTLEWNPNFFGPQPANRITFAHDPVLNAKVLLVPHGYVNGLVQFEGILNDPTHGGAIDIKPEASFVRSAFGEPFSIDSSFTAQSLNFPSGTAPPREVQFVIKNGAPAGTPPGSPVFDDVMTVTAAGGNYSAFATVLIRSTA